MWPLNYFELGFQHSPPAQNQLNTTDHLGLQQTQGRDMYKHLCTHRQTLFSHPLTVNPLIKGGNWSGGSANMVCCVIKVRVFVQQGPVPRVPIIQISGEMCPLTLAEPTRSSCHLALDNMCACVLHIFYLISIVYLSRRVGNLISLDLETSVTQSLAFLLQPSRCVHVSASSFRSLCYFADRWEMLVNYSNDSRSPQVCLDCQRNLFGLHTAVVYNRAVVFPSSF